MTVIQATANIPVSEDTEEVAKQRARLGAEALMFFDAYTSDVTGPTISYDSLEFAGVTYLFDVVARFARKR